MDTSMRYRGKCKSKKNVKKSIFTSAVYFLIDALATSIISWLWTKIKIFIIEIGDSISQLELSRKLRYTNKDTLKWIKQVY